MNYSFNKVLFKKALKQKGLNRQELADILTEKGVKITLDGINFWFRAPNNKPDIEKIKVIAEILDVSFNDLATIDDEMVENLVSEYTPKNMLFLPKSEMRIGAGSEGVYDLEMLQKDERKIAVDKAFLKGLDTKHLRIFEVVGDSMEPDFYEGDWAIADMVAGRGDFVRIAGVYIVRVDDVVYIKRVEFLPQNKIKLISLNQKYSDMYPHKEGYECEILGKVCGKVHCEIYKGLTFEDYGIK